MLNPNLNALSLATEYAIDQRIRIKDVLKLDAAQQALQHCAADVPFDLVCHFGGKNHVFGLAHLRSHEQ